jgi:hypothetical protein
MRYTTLGQLVVETARGREKLRAVSSAELLEAFKDLSRRLTPAIERLRCEQRQRGLSSLLIDSATATNG